MVIHAVAAAADGRRSVATPPAAAGKSHPAVLRMSCCLHITCVGLALCSAGVVAMTACRSLTQLHVRIYAPGLDSAIAVENQVCLHLKTALKHNHLLFVFIVFIVTIYYCYLPYYF